MKGEVKSKEKEGEMSAALKKTTKEAALFLKVRKRCWLQDPKSCSTHLAKVIQKKNQRDIYLVTFVVVKHLALKK